MTRFNERMRVRTQSVFPRLPLTTVVDESAVFGSIFPQQGAVNIRYYTGPGVGAVYRNAVSLDDLYDYVSRIQWITLPRTYSVDEVEYDVDALTGSILATARFSILLYSGETLVATLTSVSSAKEEQTDSVVWTQNSGTGRLTPAVNPGNQSFRDVRCRVEVRYGSQQLHPSVVVPPAPTSGQEFDVWGEITDGGFNPQQFAITPTGDATTEAESEVTFELRYDKRLETARTVLYEGVAWSVGGLARPEKGLHSLTLRRVIS